MKRESDLTIGKLARKAGVGVETIRFYERQGLIRKPAAPATGFRRYPAEDAIRIGFIKRAQELGFTLREAKQLLEINSRPSASCSEIKAKARAKLAEVEARLRDLEKMKDALHHLIQACASGRQAVSQCDVMGCFAEDCGSPD